MPVVLPLRAMGNVQKGKNALFDRRIEERRSAVEVVLLVEMCGMDKNSHYRI